MQELNPVIKELKQLDKKELLVVFLRLLESKHISYSDLSSVYVKFLENADNSNKELICELAISLSMFKDKFTGGTWEQAEAKANKALIASRIFKETKYEQKMIDELNAKAYKLNPIT